ncbi:hypothetical protein [Intestinibacillus massiliensis]|uniref:hypothetical protein n=1 Tax=Intestinibacillus massiliensis TaxID=1871029 RepID=UPI00117AC440|nr:hypothetical protein [Intestinibacillus massiliensis]
MKHLKKLALAIVCVMAITSLSAMAMDFDNANVITKATSSPLDGSSLSFKINTSSGLATYDATVTGNTSVTKARVSSVVQKSVGGDWVSVPGTYEESTQNGRYATVKGSQYVAKGYYYRLQTVNTVWVGSTEYTETHYSSLKDYT